MICKMLRLLQRVAVSCSYRSKLILCVRFLITERKSEMNQPPDQIRLICKIYKPVPVKTVHVSQHKFYCLWFL